MSEVTLKHKLTNCFRAVLPTLPEASIPSASVATVADWDSIAGITLLHLVEEEFQIQIDLDRISELTSFESLVAFLSANRTYF